MTHDYKVIITKNNIRKGKLIMSLAAEIISVDKRHMLSQDIYTDSYHTGFLPLDYANGYWMKVMAPDGSYVDRKMLGIGSGSLISLISE